MRAGVERLSKEMGQPKWFEILQAVVAAMAPYARHGVNVNVDFYSGVVYHLLGLKRDLFVPIFAIGRVPGWVVQVMEQQENNILIRPLTLYNGPAGAALPADRASAGAERDHSRAPRGISRLVSPLRRARPSASVLRMTVSHNETLPDPIRRPAGSHKPDVVQRRQAAGGRQIKQAADAGRNLHAFDHAKVRIAYGRRRRRRAHRRPGRCAAYPERPIELIVPWGPGGGADQLARLVSKQIEPMLGQGIPVVNVPGGTGATGMAKLLSAPADGYSMAIYIADSHALLAGKTPRWTDERHHAGRGDDEGALVHLREGGQQVQELDRFRQRRQGNPGKLKVATLGFGSVDDFSLTVLAHNGIKVTQVPFSKPSERYVSILGDHADALYEQAGDVAQFLNSKQMRPILLFGEKRLDRFKDIPASYELGYKIALPQFRSIVVKRRHAAGHRAEAVGRARQGLCLGRVQEVHGGAVLRSEQLRGCQRTRPPSSTSSSRT